MLYVYLRVYTLNISTPCEDPMYTLNLQGSRQEAGGLAVGGGGTEATGGTVGPGPAVFLERAAVRGCLHHLTIFISVLLLNDPFHNRRFSNGTGRGLAFRTLWPVAWVGRQSSLSLSVLTGHSR